MEPLNSLTGDRSPGNGSSRQRREHVAACLAGILNVSVLASPLSWSRCDANAWLSVGIFLSVVSLLFAIERYASTRRFNEAEVVTAADRPALWAGLCGCLLLFAALFAGVVERVTQANNPMDWQELTGWVLMLGGCVLRYFAIHALAGRFRTETTVPSNYRLQTSGIYSVLRHPSEVGLLALLAGAALFLNSTGAWVLTAFQVPLVAWRVSIENQCFERSLGETFQSYRRQVAGFVPYLF